MALVTPSHYAAARRPRQWNAAGAARRHRGSDERRMVRRQLVAPPHDDNDETGDEIALLWQAIQQHSTAQVAALASKRPALLLESNACFANGLRGCVPLDAAIRHGCPLDIVLVLAENMPPEFLDETKSSVSTPGDLSQKRTLRELLAWYGQHHLDDQPSPGMGATKRATWGAEPTTTEEAHLMCRSGLRGDEAKQAWWARQLRARERGLQSDTPHWRLTTAGRKTRGRVLTRRESQLVSKLCSAIQTEDSESVARLARIAPVSKGEAAGKNGAGCSLLVSALLRRAPYSLIKLLVRRNPAALMVRDPLAKQLPLELAIEMDSGLETVYSLAGEYPPEFLDTTWTSVERKNTQGQERCNGDVAVEEQHVRTEVEEGMVVSVTLRERLLEYGLGRMDVATAANVCQMRQWRDVLAQQPITNPAARQVSREKRHGGRRTDTQEVGKAMDGEVAAAQQRIKCRDFLTAIYLHGYVANESRR